jgi:nucleoside-diphosphate-sugar epimerase
MARILITGTHSFVGRNIINYSQFKDVEEISLFENSPEDIDFGKYDVIIHLVAIVHQTKAISAEEYFQINKDLCIRVAKNAKKAHVGQFIFLSTVKVYGLYQPGSEPWNEYSECHPVDSYGQSKYEAEKELKKLEDPNFIISIIRTPLVYGEGVRANMLNIIKLVKSSFILPFKDINNIRCFTSAENLVGFIDRIIERKASGIFIAKDERAISTTELVKMISQNLEKKIILFKLPGFILKIGLSFMPRIFDRLYGSFEMDNSATLKILDFKPPVSVEEGIRIMVGSFK